MGVSDFEQAVNSHFRAKSEVERLQASVNQYRESLEHLEGNLATAQAEADEALSKLAEFAPSLREADSAAESNVANGR